MKFFFIVFALLFFAAVFVDASAQAKNSLPTKKALPPAKKSTQPPRKSAQQPKKSVLPAKKGSNVSSKKASLGKVVSKLVADPCNSVTACSNCFVESGCYWDTAAQQCNNASLVVENGYCPAVPSSDAVSMKAQTFVVLMSIVFLFV